MIRDMKSKAGCQREHMHKALSTKAEVDQNATQHKKDIRMYCTRNYLILRLLSYEVEL